MQILFSSDKAGDPLSHWAFPPLNVFVTIHFIGVPMTFLFLHESANSIIYYPSVDPVVLKFLCSRLGTIGSDRLGFAVKRYAFFGQGAFLPAASGNEPAQRTGLKCIAVIQYK
jgi:hypothetical protein